MLVHCTSCNQQTDARINKKTGQVVCALCQGEVKVTSFARQAMEQSRDYIEEAKTGFCFECNKCREMQPAVSNAAGTEAICTKCGTKIANISPFMIKMMHRMGKVVGKKQEEEKE